MTETRPRAVDQYLRQLERGLRDLPADRRDEIVGEIEEHIVVLLGELGHAPGEADVRNVLERVGEPDDIAREALDSAEPAPQPVRWTDTAAVVALPIPFVGWIVGAVLLWLSNVWTTRDKVVGTLAGPGLFILGGLATISASAGGVEGGGRRGARSARDARARLCLPGSARRRRLPRLEAASAPSSADLAWVDEPSGSDERDVPPHRLERGGNRVCDDALAW